MTNKEVASLLGTSEQVVKNNLRTTFDKFGVWTRLELALYVAGHGGANWYSPLGSEGSSPSPGWGARPSGQAAVLAGEKGKAAAATGGIL
jgi:hypothetical protein